MPLPLNITLAESSVTNRNSKFFASLSAPYTPVPLSVVPDKPDLTPPIRLLEPRKPPQNVLHEPIYRPSSKWLWIKDSPVEDVHTHDLSSGAMCRASIRTSKVSDRSFQYVTKTWPHNEHWTGFFSELALYKTQLRCLQGISVPAIINVFVDVGGVNVAFEPPHHSFWIEASIDMPLVLKQRCVDAYKKLHAQKILHGDVELRHMLIGGDGRVTIIDFQGSRSSTPMPDVGLERAWPDESEREMRKVLVKLDYPAARETEQKRQTQDASLSDLDPIPLDEWGSSWIFPDFAPKRFVMPGQTLNQLKTEVEAFLNLIDKWEKAEFRQPQVLRSVVEIVPRPLILPSRMALYAPPTTSVAKRKIDVEDAVSRRRIKRHRAISRLDSPELQSPRESPHDVGNGHRSLQPTIPQEFLLPNHEKVTTGTAAKRKLDSDESPSQRHPKAQKTSKYREGHKRRRNHSRREWFTIPTVPTSVLSWTRGFMSRLIPQVNC